MIPWYHHEGIFCVLIGCWCGSYRARRYRSTFGRCLCFGFPYYIYTLIPEHEVRLLSVRASVVLLERQSPELQGEIAAGL